MTKEMPEHIYHKQDIDRAFNMGVEATLALFEQTVGLSHDKQRYILSRIKNMLIEDKAAVAMNKSHMKI